MSQNTWNAVDDCFGAALQPLDEALAASVVDNVVRGGRVVESTNAPMVAGTRVMVDLIAKGKRVCATALQTVGHKCHDGLLFALVVADS